VQRNGRYGRKSGTGWMDEEPEMVRVLEEDPELGRYLPTGELALASTAAIAPLLTIEQGPTSFLIDEPLTHGHLGLLMLDGLIARRVFFGQLGASEFYGPGDLLRPWIRADSTVQVRWEVLAPTRLAALDQDFAGRVHAWPELAAGLLDRAAERSELQAIQAALHQAKRAEDRILLALWHFAGRWGETGPEGRTVRLPNVTGELLAQFIGARRQTVSTALGRLADSGELIRNLDGSLTLPRRPPELDTIAARTPRADPQPRVRGHG
jgi:CRP/FNR family transcriptional regulator, cyclic AMP receptor protein